MLKKQIASTSLNDFIVDRLNIGLIILVCILLIAVFLLMIAEPKSADDVLSLNAQGTEGLPGLKLIKKSIKYYERILGRRALFMAQPWITKPKIRTESILESGVSTLNLELQGIISGAQGPQAMLSNIKTEQSFYCSGGETIDGFRVKQVLLDRVILERDGEILELKL